jgi:MFS family permease
MPENIRGRYLGLRDAFCISAMSVVTLIFGRMLDLYESGNEERKGFTIIAVAIIVLALINFISLLLIKEPPFSGSTYKVSIYDAFIRPMKSIQFNKVIILSVFWNIGIFLSMPFYAAYLLNELKLSYTSIMVVNLVATLARVIAAPFWGRLIRAKSWVFILKLSIALYSIISSLWIFMNPGTVSYIFPVVSILSSVISAGIGISLFNLQFMFSPKEKRTTYLALYGSVTGLAGFLSTLFGSILLGFLSHKYFYIFSFKAGSMQLVFLLSSILTASALILIRSLKTEFIKLG